MSYNSVIRSEDVQAFEKLNENYDHIKGRQDFMQKVNVSHSRKNRHKKALKNGMNRRNSFDFSQSVAFIPRFA